jgi:hypothetical protein
MAKAKSKTKTKAKAKSKAKPARKSDFVVDWSDEDSVKVAMGQALDVPLDDMEIEEERGLSSFDEGTVYQISVGRQEYAVAEDQDAVEKLAVAVVLQDLKDSPDSFEQGFIQSHIDMDRLRRDLHSDVYDMNYERLKEEAERKPMEFLKDNNIDIPEPTKKQMQEYADAMGDDDKPSARYMDDFEVQGDAEDRWIILGEEPEVPDSEIEAITESETKEQLKDPVSYLSDIYGDGDAVKKAIEIGGIDEQAAAEEAVNVDGAGHFLSGYDGNLHDGPGGIVYWRTN